MKAFVDSLLDSDAKAPVGFRTWNKSDPSCRYDVYKNNVMLSLVEAIETSYPVVAVLAGTQVFHSLAVHFVRSNPPKSPVLTRYGEGFADFVESSEVALRLPYLADIARLEWSYIESFHAYDSQVLNTKSLVSLLSNPDHLLATSFHFCSSVRLIRSRHPVVSIWGAVLELSDHHDLNLSTPEAALVVRPSMAVQVIPISQEASHFIGYLMAGYRLESACQQGMGNVDRILSDVFQLLLQTGSLSGFEVDLSLEM
ncbi:DNA-binding domain-containing protein [Limnobacter sp.]|uniref:HvfC/BufC N-terminal domain-containing protein n=1 Tax=Limnobacter sp. TaxID=2003368 RepID=UPI002732F8E5|nr:DNA-binding domain-containing protein [Limnobacter sp.]MDP3189067.1 DNA-binding domain-containing protein [Limnobacter sp.]